VITPELLSIIENIHRNVKKARNNLDLTESNNDLIDYLNHIESLTQQAEKLLTNGQVYF